MRSILLIALSFILGWCLNWALGQTAIQARYYQCEHAQWIGHPMVSDNDFFTPSQGWLTGVQIGLCPDGVVIWKKVEKPNGR